MTNSVFTMISSYTKNKVSSDDYKTIVSITKQAASKASEAINESEQNLVSWFKDQGVIVQEVNKQPFVDAIQPLLNSQDNGFTAEQLAELEAL